MARTRLKKKPKTPINKVPKKAPTKKLREKLQEQPQHFYTQIDGWFDYQSIYARMVRDAKDGAHFVEVGCWKGQSSAYMAVEIQRSGKEIRFDCVDTWQGSPEHQGDPDVVSGRLYKSFLKNMRPVKGVYRARRMSSVEAAATYADNSLDFVWLDADHSFSAISADIRAWLPKIRVGGWLGGHDHSFKEALGVPIACRLLLGQYHVVPPSPHSRWPVNSWLWQKPDPAQIPITGWLTWARQMLT